MRIQNGGIFREIDEKDFGKFQQKGWTKVLKNPIQEKKEEIKKEEIKKEEVIIPVVHKDIIDDTMNEVLGEFNLDIPAKPKPKVKPKAKKK